jgi:hypothetical protein
LKFVKDPQWNPGKSNKPERRLAWHLAFCREALERGDAWVTSTPSAGTCRIEVTPGSPWPAMLRERGFPLEGDGEGQRIVPHAIREVVHVNHDGTISPLVEGSTAPTKAIDHAGIIKVLRYRFRAP